MIELLRVVRNVFWSLKYIEKYGCLFITFVCVYSSDSQPTTELTHTYLLMKYPLLYENLIKKKYLKFCQIVLTGCKKKNFRDCCSLQDLVKIIAHESTFYNQISVLYIDTRQAIRISTIVL